MSQRVHVVIKKHVHRPQPKLFQVEGLGHGNDLNIWPQAQTILKSKDSTMQVLGLTYYKGLGCRVKGLEFIGQV